jgi:hypothetical protein
MARFRHGWTELRYEYCEGLGRRCQVHDAVSETPKLFAGGEIDMAIYHIAYHAYKRAPSEKETRDRLAMLNAAFAAAPYVEDGFVGRYLGNPPDGYHDAACVCSILLPSIACPA